MSVTVYAQTVYDGAAHAMESCTVPWVLVQKTAPVFVSGNKHFFVSRKALHLWSQMRRPVVLCRNWSASLCLVVA